MNMKNSECNADKLFQIGQELCNTKNYEEAIKIFERAADAGSTDAVDKLIFFYGFPTPYSDEEKFFMVYQKFANVGNVKAMNYLAKIYYNRYIFGAVDLHQSENLFKMFEWYQKAIDCGDTKSMKDLASMYQRNKDAKEISKAIYWYEKAADTEDSFAMRELAEMYLQGDGVEKNISKALEWYEKSARAKNTIAMRELAEMYLQGKDVEKNISQAVYWYEKAVELDDWEAIKKLAEMYRNGEDVEKNDQKADELMKIIDDELKKLLDIRTGW